MSRQFGHDFSSVRVHSDPLAAASARAIDAQAYTVGQHVVFAAGRFQPTRDDGQHLLMHELVHVVQQSTAGPAALTPTEMTEPGDDSERAATRIANSPSGTATSAVRGLRRLMVQRDKASPPPHGFKDCDEKRQDQIKAGIDGGKQLAAVALKKLDGLSPFAFSAERHNFGELNSAARDTVVERFGKVSGALDAAVIACKKTCPKSKHTFECGEGRLGGHDIFICPKFGDAGCDPSETMLHEAIHNTGADGDIDTGKGYPPKNAQDNAYSYEHYAVDVTKPPPEPPSLKKLPPHEVGLPK